MRVLQNIWFQIRVHNPNQHDDQNQYLRGHGSNCSANNLKPWKWSKSEDQNRIQDHITNQTKKICHKRCLGISLRSRKSGQSQI